ncbi:MAG: SDR family NAD(P)-dependent oxidoreductase [Acidimicrobiia bacterium]|nr:SDR family NAD(P)-dependent oxidoreductase [Acidimicrobiia bacterium]NNC42829.1 SDR family NAD(P)-dependent oxidoreductase [Acidimicrobiia bacterium]
MNLADSSAIVTGGASGLGEATARLLASRGAAVVIVDRSADKADAVAADIGGRAVPADVTNTEEIALAVRTAAERAPLRSLVNCAGIGWAQRTVGRDGSPHGLDTFEKVISVNLVGTFNCIRLAAASMAQNDPDEQGERGAIVNTASVAAIDGQIGQAAYSASKGGVVGMTLPIARDLAAVGIRVSTIAPGLIDTPLFDSLPEEAKTALGASVLFPPRLGRPDEYAELALFLLTHPYMNAETVRMDGGIRMPPK